MPIVSLSDVNAGSCADFGCASQGEPCSASACGFGYDSFLRSDGGSGELSAYSVTSAENAGPKGSESVYTAQDIGARCAVSPRSSIIISSSSGSDGELSDSADSGFSEYFCGTSVKTMSSEELRLRYDSAVRSGNRLDSARTAKMSEAAGWRDSIKAAGLRFSLGNSLFGNGTGMLSRSLMLLSSGAVMKAGGAAAIAAGKAMLSCPFTQAAGAALIAKGEAVSAKGEMLLSTGASQRSCGTALIQAGKRLVQESMRQACGFRRRLSAAASALQRLSQRRSACSQTENLLAAELNTRGLAR